MKSILFGTAALAAVAFTVPAIAQTSAADAQSNGVSGAQSAGGSMGTSTDKTNAGAMNADGSAMASGTMKKGKKHHAMTGTSAGTNAMGSSSGTGTSGDTGSSPMGTPH